MFLQVLCIRGTPHLFTAKIFTLEALRSEVMGHIVSYFPLLRGEEKKKPCKEGHENLYPLSKYLTVCSRCVFKKDTIQVNLIIVKQVKERCICFRDRFRTCKHFAYFFLSELSVSGGIPTMITVPCSTSIGAAMTRGSSLQRLFFVWKSESFCVTQGSEGNLISALHVRQLYKT